MDNSELVPLVQNAIQGPKPNKKHRSSEEKLRELDELESMMKDPDQRRKIEKLIRWIRPEGKGVQAMFPSIVAKAFQENIAKKRIKAKLTEDQRASIKEVYI